MPNPNENYFLEMQFILVARAIKKLVTSTEHPRWKQFWKDEWKVFNTAYKKMEAINNAETVRAECVMLIEALL